MFVWFVWLVGSDGRRRFVRCVQADDLWEGDTAVTRYARTVAALVPVGCSVVVEHRHAIERCVIEVASYEGRRVVLDAA